MAHRVGKQPFKFHHDYIALSTRNGCLALRTYGSPPARFEAQFLDITPEDALASAGDTLSRKERFSCMLTHPWTVLQHQEAMANYAEYRKESPRTIFRCRVHDIGEAFLPDVANPFKNDVDRAREEAVINALPWPEVKFGHDKRVKFYDTLACVAEAIAFGPGWPWTEEYQHPWLESYVNYVKVFAKTFTRRELVRDSWIARVSERL